MKLVIIESPYAGNVAINTRYLRAAMRDRLLRGEAPFASHAIYTLPGVLDDNKKDERALGIEAGLLWGRKADKAVVYDDLGISDGTRQGIASALLHGREVEFRSLSESEWSKQRLTGRGYWFADEVEP